MNHRRTVNAEQLAVLELLYRFRFGSNDLFAQYFGKKDRSFVYKRLNILLERGLIGKRFDSSYRIQGRPAAYYLTPDGARLLQEHRGSDKDPVNVKAIYKDATVKDDFVAHCLTIFRIYNALQQAYGDGLKFFAKAQLNYGKYDYFPHPLPDAYLRLTTGDHTKQFFLDVFCEDQPFFVAVRRVLSYASYADEADWAATDTDLPVVLAVCDSASLAKRIQKRMVKTLNDAYDEDLIFALTITDDVYSGNTAIWRKPDDPDEPSMPLEVLS